MIGKIIETVNGIIGKFIPDKTTALEMQSEASKAILNFESELIARQGNIIATEAKSESWIARNWRPITMLLFVVIIANNYLVAPYLDAFGVKAVFLQLPDKMWSLLEIGLGGYIIGRSVEKTMKNWKQ